MAKSKNRSGFLFMFVLLVLIGAVVYTFRDRFQVMFNNGYSSGKNFIQKNFDKKDNAKIAKDKIEKLDEKNKDQSKDKINDSIKDIKDNLNQIKDKLTKSESSSSKSENKNDPDKKEIKTVFNSKSSESSKKNSSSSDTKKEGQNSSTKIKKESKDRSSKLYFAKITDSDKILLVSVERNVNYADTPLTETINSLLKGPSQNEKKKEMITNIPEKTRLLSVTIKDNTAYMNFSKEFEFNTFGREATVAQVKQIVYTATEFPNIKSVQILIDGKTKKYLGGEGVLINKPLTRNDLS